MESVFSLTQLALTGEPITIQVSEMEFGQLSIWEQVDLVVFLAFYIAYILIALIVLLNMLISMINQSYEKAVKQSSLRMRVSYARQTLQLEELVAQFPKAFQPDMHVGERKGKGTRWYFEKIAANIFTHASNLWEDKQAEAKRRQEQVEEEKRWWADHRSQERIEAEAVRQNDKVVKEGRRARKSTRRSGDTAIEVAHRPAPLDLGESTRSRNVKPSEVSPMVGIFAAMGEGVE